MNEMQKQMQLLSYNLGLKTLSEALKRAKKAKDDKAVGKVLKDMEKLMKANERLLQGEKTWLH